MGESIIWHDPKVDATSFNWNTRWEKSLWFHFGLFSAYGLCCIFNQEATITSIFNRWSNSTSVLNVAILNLSFLANNLLNVCCGLGDLGCISFILWGFEDRECILELCEFMVGARMHGHFEGLVGKKIMVMNLFAKSKHFVRLS